MKRPRSLLGRLLALVLTAVVTVWLATAVATWVDVRDELDELLDGHLAQAAALLVVQSSEVGDDEVIDAPTLHRYAPKAAFQVFHEGRLVLRSANAPATPMAEPADHFSSGFRSIRLDGSAWRVFAAYGAERDVQVYVGEQLASRASILKAVLESTLWPMAVALPILALAAWLATYGSLRPLRRLVAALAGRRADSLHRVTLDDAPSEIAPVVDALNGLFERIADLLDSERRFTADAAHELRTPIAAIRAQAQVALGEADEAQRRHALRSTLEGCDRAARLVEQLLTLARLEVLEARNAVAVDLAAIARRVVAELAAAAAGRRQTLEVEAPPSCRVRGDETLLAVLVSNLVDNAMRYSGSDARVRVRVGCGPTGIALSVEDSGPGLSPSDLGRLGERFFRVAGSGQSGSGLGWSIVKRIAAVHGFELEAGRSSELGGLAVHLTCGASQDEPAHAGAGMHRA